MYASSAGFAGAATTSCTPVLAADGRKWHLGELSPLSLLISKCPSQPPRLGTPLLRPEGAQPSDSGGPSFVSNTPNWSTVPAYALRVLSSFGVC